MGRRKELWDEISLLVEKVRNLELRMKLAGQPFPPPTIGNVKMLLDDHVARGRMLQMEIQGLPGADGWWNSESLNTYLTVTENLLAMGWDCDQIIELLRACYDAAAQEYGD